MTLSGGGWAFVAVQKNAACAGEIESETHERQQQNETGKD